MAVLTVFFSMKGETIAPGMKIVNLDKGHTAVGAEIIQSAMREVECDEADDCTERATVRSIAVGQ